MNLCVPKKEKKKKNHQASAMTDIRCPNYWWPW